MNRDHEDEHGGRSPTGSKSTDDPQVHSVPKSSDEKDLESTRTRLKDSELSPTDELSGKEISCLISPLSKMKPVAFDVHIKEVPADVKKPFQDVLNAPGSDNSDSFPVSVQLPANHLKNLHITAYKATHHHRKMSRSSTSTLKSLKAPAEDLCASFLLACLFCKFWDCLLAVGDGCQYCVTSICTSFCSHVCCCDPSSLEDFIDFCPCCSCAECVEACGCSCAENAFDCSICDLCLQTTECLELGMELSQLLFH
ncbi:myoD family inhibitor domain-containing protein 2 [Megalobrama amblycephala]|uniref:myoD family inhibitor domain-containing protein 2 n=1 Tax=Megalobrama amblycephala TaxID=75352 RepID=UPI002013FDC3|nr:myoD family inhibitor domain-containing protein 2 [Megalobrama amblycephala]